MFSEQGPHPYDTKYLEETINDIKSALIAPDFNPQDRDEVTASLEYFQARHNRLQVVAGQAIRSSELAA